MSPPSANNASDQVRRVGQDAAAFYPAVKEHFLHFSGRKVPVAYESGLLPATDFRNDANTLVQNVVRRVFYVVAVTFIISPIISGEIVYRLGCALIAYSGSRLAGETTNRGAGRKNCIHHLAIAANATVMLFLFPMLIMDNVFVKDLAYPQDYKQIKLFGKEMR